MSRTSTARLVASVYDAALAPELWPAALGRIAEHFSAAGADYSLWNKENGRVEWLSMTGPMVQSQTDYIEHYYAVDPFHRVASQSPMRRWVQATKALPRTVLRGSEWYNEFLLKSDIKDLMAIRLYDTTSHVVFFELHRGVGRVPLIAESSPILRQLLEPLAKAARLRIELRKAGLQSAVRAPGTGVSLHRSDHRRSGWSGNRPQPGCRAHAATTGWTCALPRHVASAS